MSLIATCPYESAIMLAHVIIVSQDLLFFLIFSIFRYGLLGASGSGKTTLLRCVLGRLPIHSGTISILGKPPGAPGHTVPGKDVGYMPQVSII